MIDQTLGHYRVLERVGKGGMGVVYRARDEHLERDVALKVLDPGMLANENARRRFKKEALALSKLNHANIEAVYDFNSQDGVDFLVMEFVEGMTLTQKLSTGPLSLSEVTTLGKQIAQALEEAHGKGIIHRDLKPGNIMVTPKGQVKVLDFGLATLLHKPEEDGSPPSFGVAETAAAGTLPYVAPEQLRGGRVDQRSDIYAAGAVLYEMATSRRLFTETDSIELIRAILQQAPQSLTRGDTSVPPELARIIEKALDKSPERRFQSAKALRDVLEKLEEELEGSWLRRVHPVVWLLILASAVVGGRIFWNILFPPEKPLNARLTRLITTPSVDSDSRISPDGKWVSISSSQARKGTIWLQHPGVGDREEKHHFNGTISSHIWSPDGKELAVVLSTESGVFLSIVPAMGGPPRRRLKLDSNLDSGRLVRWIGSDIYMEVAATGLWDIRLTSEPSPRLVLARQFRRGDRTNFDLCADGKTLVYTLARSAKRTLWLSDLDGRNPRQVPLEDFEPSHARWLSRGCDRLVFVSGQGGEADLWQVAAGGGRPTRITFSGGVKRLGETSLDGSHLTFLDLHDRANLRLLDPRSEPVRRWQLTTESLLDFWPSIAPGSGLLAFQRSVPTEGGNPEIFGARIFLTRLEGNRLEEMKALVPEGGEARLSPSGEYLAYVRRGASGHRELWLKEIRSGRERKACERFRFPLLYSTPLDWVKQNMVWSPDGSRLYFVVIEGSGKQAILSFDPSREADAARWLSRAKGREEDFTDLYPSRDGRSLCYVRSDGIPGTVSALICLDLSTGVERHVYSETHDKKGDLIFRGFLDSGRSLLVLSAASLEDWTESLKVLRVTGSGTPVLLGKIDRGFGGTARLDPKAELLFMTKADVETGVQNLWEFRLSDGKLRPLTDNPSAQVTFSGLEMLNDGRLIYSEQERDSEFRLITFQP